MFFPNFNYLPYSCAELKAKKLKMDLQLNKHVYHNTYYDFICFVLHFYIYNLISVANFYTGLWDKTQKLTNKQTNKKILCYQGYVNCQDLPALPLPRPSAQPES